MPAVLHDACRAVLAHLRGDRAWLRAGDSPEHFRGLTDVLGGIAADALIAEGRARGMKPDRARSRAIAQMPKYLDGAGLLLIGNGVSPDDLSDVLPASRGLASTGGSS
jgi:predicted TIM-barrel enzyme